MSEDVDVVTVSRAPDKRRWVSFLPADGPDGNEAEMVTLDDFLDRFTPRE